jgi:HAD superfamily hydrolase (TIGR01490 family)
MQMEHTSACQQGLAIFDVCGTFVDFLTTPAFLEFISRKHLRKGLAYYFLKVCSRLRLLRPERFKSHEIALLRGLPRNILEEYGKEFCEIKIIPYMRPKVLEIWTKHKREGRICILASGALDVFLKPMADFLKADHLICSELKYDEVGICTGDLVGEDNVGTSKAQNVLRTFGYLLNSSISFAYTDSESDIPLLELVDYPYVVAITPPTWALKRAFPVISP